MAGTRTPKRSKLKPWSPGVLEKLWEYFAPMRKRREEILRDKSYIDNVLTRGAKRANEIADQVMQRVRKAVGLC